MNCPQCESILLTDVFKTPNPVRCAACGDVSVPQSQTSIEANRYAWRSFWLGLTSIVLLFLTGIPAIWYGVRSLLQMRFIRSQKNDRKAAIVGVGLGILFGIIGSGIVVLIGGFALMFMMLIEETNEPERIQEILSTIGTIDIPESLHAVEANRMANQFDRVNWRDGSKPESANGRIRLFRSTSGAQFGEVQLGALSSFELHRGIKVESSPDKNETLSWKFVGESCDVEKVVEQAKNGDFKVTRYWTSTKPRGEQQYFGLGVSIRTPGKYTEEDVQKIFESFEPKLLTSPVDSTSQE